MKLRRAKRVAKEEVFIALEIVVKLAAALNARSHLVLIFGVTPPHRNAVDADAVRSQLRGVVAGHTFEGGL